MLAASKVLFSSNQVRWGATGPGATGGAALSWTHTPKSTDNCVVVATNSYSGTGVPSTPTYGGTSMTPLQFGFNIASASDWLYAWALKITPGQGAKTVSLGTKSGYNVGNSVSYTGVGQILNIANGGLITSTQINLLPPAFKGLLVVAGGAFSSATLALLSPITTRYNKLGASFVNESFIMGDALASAEILSMTASSSSGLGMGYIALQAA